MEATLNLVLFKGKKHSDGTHPIQLQLHVSGMSPQRKTVYRCFADDWDAKKSRVKPRTRNASYINNVLSEEYLTYERKKLQILNGEIGPEDFFKKKVVLTLDYIIVKEMDRFRDTLQTGSYKRFAGYRVDLLNYFDSVRTNIASIGLPWYQKYAEFLARDTIADGKVVRKKNNGSTIQKKVKTIRRLVEKYSGVTPTEEVRAFRVASKKPVKHKWTEEEMSRFEGLVLEPDSLLSVVRDLFLLQIYLRGSRVGALLMAYSHQFTNGRYVANNEDGAKNNVSCKIIAPAQVIIDRYTGRYDRLFPLYKFEPDPRASEFDNKYRKDKQKEVATSVVNKNLKVLASMAGIEKKASSHLARHIFTKKAIDKIKNPMITMDLLGHKSLAVHQTYLKDVLNEDALDDATDEIFG